MFAITKKKKLLPKSPPPGSPPAAVPARTVILPGLIAALFVRQHQRQCLLPLLSRSIACRCACASASSRSAGIFRCADIPGSHRRAGKRMGTALCAAEDRAGWDGKRTLHGLLLSLRAHGRGRLPCSSAEAKDRQSDTHPIHPIPKTEGSLSSLDTRALRLVIGCFKKYLCGRSTTNQANSLQLAHRHHLKSFSCPIQ
jgi:hypothetical protein